MTEYIVEEFEFDEPAIRVRRPDGIAGPDIPATRCHAFRVGEYRDGQFIKYRGRYASIAEAAILVRSFRDLDDSRPTLAAARVA